jgi:hypothetical protein
MLGRSALRAHAATPHRQEALHAAGVMPSFDASQGLEPAQLLCQLQGLQPPPRFHYAIAYVVENGAHALLDQGCGCCSGCSDCPCTSSPLDGGPCYTGTGRPTFMMEDAPEPPYLAECGPACACRSRACRASQTGLTLHISLRHTAKGWSGFAEQTIERGQFVANYLGEPISTPAALQRLEEYDRQGLGHALLVGGSRCRCPPLPLPPPPTLPRCCPSASMPPFSA